LQIDRCINRYELPQKKKKETTPQLTLLFGYSLDRYLVLVIS
jgi:hypothetical protein